MSIKSLIFDEHDTSLPSRMAQLGSSQPSSIKPNQTSTGFPSDTSEYEMRNLEVCKHRRGTNALDQRFQRSGFRVPCLSNSRVRE